MVIDVYLKNIDDFKNKFNYNELNNELGEYIFNKAIIQKITRKKGLKINIQTDFELSEQEKDNMVDILRSYYGNKIKIELIYLKKSYIKSAILFIIGIVLLMAAYFFEHLTKFLLPEIFIIVGWLAIWEMGYNVLFYDSKRRLAISLLKKLTNCHIQVE